MTPTYGTTTTAGSRSRFVQLLTLLLVAGCGGGGEPLEDPNGTLDDLSAALRGFAISNEFHYAEHRRFTPDLADLQSTSEWAPDSVELVVTVAESGQGWSALATHVRTGPGVGCVMVWGDMPRPTTPGGVTHDGENRIVCDDVFDAATVRPGVAPPRG